MLRTLLMGAAITAASSHFALAADDDKVKPEQIAAIADKLAPSLVKVEYVAQYDKGEAPGGEQNWASYYRSFYGGGGEDSNPFGADAGWDQLIREERPSERGGYLVSPTRVFTADPMLHGRFIRSITVRFGDETVSAKPAAFSKDTGGCFLELAHPFAAAKPLSFDASKESPYLSISYGKGDARWMTHIGGMRSGMFVSPDGRRAVGSPGVGIVTDKTGVPVALTGTADLPVDGSWKGDPSKWSLVTADELDAVNARCDAESSRHLVRVRLNFRSPRSQGRDNPYAYMNRYRQSGGDEEITNTEWNGLGVVMDDRTLVVLANFKTKVTGRLEQIHVFLPGDKEVAAKFDGTLKDWGAIVARLDQPVQGAAHLSQAPVTSHEDKLLVCAEVAVRGETRTAYFVRERIGHFTNGFQGRVFPMVSTGEGRGYGRYSEGTSFKHFLYTLGGDLVALPLERREKVTAQQYQGYFGGGGGESLMVPVAILTETLSQGQSAYDTDNKPVSEEEENRVAWLGAELQGMTPDLARANNCMDQTNSGVSGGIVTFMYDNSPATKAGLRIGDIVLRLHVEGQPKPLEVMVEDHGEMAGMMDQFWQAIDRMPEEYLDQMPKPWGSVENTLTKALTEIGFGTKFTAEVLRDGKVVSMPMAVTQGPAHYDSAARFKTEEMGVTVRDITYEVRRYFQMKPDEVGVILAKVERGSKASVAGLKPMETIRSVNDKPVNNVKEFEAAIKDGGEFKLSVKRMTKGRTVKLKIDPAGAGNSPVAQDKPKDPAEGGAAAPGQPAAPEAKP
jgi:serine protease Do